MRPFSLHSTQVVNPPSSNGHLWLPLHSSHKVNRNPPQISHTPGATAGKPDINFFNSPISCSSTISSAPPIYLPPIKTFGNDTLLSSLLPCPICAIIFRISSKNDESINRSRSSIGTRNPWRIDRTVRHASNVDLTALRLVR
ncbi:hypothetical protein HanIR_Chr01g0018931 [Helianthus annuus]|nr:hypothetical protein HanIR_Chr01g0018931 [Helianthus annuus]